MSLETRITDLVSAIGADIKALTTDKVDITDVIDAAHGGTGVATLTGIAKGNGTEAFTVAVPGTDYIDPAGLAAVATGTNTGDETTSTIKTKLGITTLSGSNTGDQDLSGKQDVLVSGTNIRTINGQTLLGSTDLVIASASGYEQTFLMMGA